MMNKHYDHWLECDKSFEIYDCLQDQEAYWVKTKDTIFYVEGGGMELIVKPKGYGDDPLNQRSSVGWKALETATILNDQYLVRVESCSTFAEQAQAN